MKRADLVPGTRVEIVTESLGSYCRKGTTGTVIVPNAPLGRDFAALVQLDGDPIGSLCFRASELRRTTATVPVPA